MAYTATITPTSVTNGSDICTVTLYVVVNDGVTDILDFNVSAKYNINSPDMTALRADFQGAIKGVWDEYIYCNNILTGAALSTLVTTLSSQTETYINS